MKARIVVVGSGIMGSGIARVLATSGYRVVLTDVDGCALEKAMGTVRHGLAREKERGRISEKDLEDVMGRLQGASSPRPYVEDALMVIEAIPEELSLKKELFSDIAKDAGKDTILATNTSQLSITEIASATSCPDRVVGMHWFNPAYRMKLVEIVRGESTSDEAVEVAVDVAKSAGKEVVIALDRQGFITTRVLSAFLIECYRVYEEGVASMEDIDTAVRLAFNHPMGPFELSDLIGLDTMLEACKGLEDALGERFRAPRVLVDLVEAGKVGGKKGSGFLVSK